MLNVKIRHMPTMPLLIARGTLPRLKTRPIWAVIVMAIGIVASAQILAGCSAAAPGKTTLTVYTGQGWSFMTVAAKNFETSHPGVIVDLKQTSGQPYFNDLPRTLPTADTPDITVLQVIPGPYDTVVKQKQLVPLNGIWDSMHLARYYPASLVKNYDSGGDYYGIPMDLLWMPIFWFNETALQKLGLPVPASHQWPSLEAFLSWAQAVDKTGHSSLVSGITDNDGAAFVFSSELQSACGTAKFRALEDDAAIASGDASWHDPCVSAALTSLRSIEMAAGVSPFPATMSDTEATASFEGQRALGYSTGSWETVAAEQDHVSFQLGWTLPPPAANGSAPQMMVADLDAFGINSRSQHVALARQFLAYVASRQFESIPTVESLLPGLPPRSDVPIVGRVPELNLQQDHFIGEFGSQTQLTTAVPFEASVEGILASYLSGSLSETDTESNLQSMALSTSS